MSGRDASADVPALPRVHASAIAMLAAAAAKTDKAALRRLAASDA